jgi:hypothetical protein
VGVLVVGQETRKLEMYDNSKQDGSGIPGLTKADSHFSDIVENDIASIALIIHEYRTKGSWKTCLFCPKFVGLMDRLLVLFSNTRPSYRKTNRP